MKLLTYILKRLLFMLLVMAGVAVIVFFITRVIPADPVGAILGGNAPPERVDAMRHKLGLDQPIPLQFVAYVQGIVRGDFGVSLKTNRPVLDDLKDFFPATVELAVAAILITIVFGILLGILSAVHRNTWLDHVLRVFSILGVSMPVFWLGLLLLVVFYFHLDWVPGSGRHSLFIFPPRITGLVIVDSLITGNWAVLWDALRHLILPAFVLGYASVASVARIMRASMLDVLSQDFIRTAKAKGLSKHLVIYRHALRNALIPVVTIIGISFGSLLSGAVLTETVFSWPGVGRYVVQALLFLDYPAVVGGTLFIAFLYSIANLIVDITYVVLDPRMHT